MDEGPLAAILRPEDVRIGLRVASKPALLDWLAREAAAGYGLDAPSLGRLLVAREALGSTGVGGGIALPHARVPGLDTPRGMFLRLAAPLAFEAIDGRGVDLVFLLLSAPEAQAAHLAALAAVARRLRDPERSAAARVAPTAAALHALLAG